MERTIAAAFLEDEAKAMGNFIAFRA